MSPLEASAQMDALFQMFNPVKKSTANALDLLLDASSGKAGAQETPSQCSGGNLDALGLGASNGSGVVESPQKADEESPEKSKELTVAAKPGRKSAAKPQAQHRARPQAGASGNTGGANDGTPAVPAPNATAKKGKGRPKKDMSIETGVAHNYLVAFRDKLPGDTIWWGPEYQTQVKEFKGVLDVLAKRIADSREMCEVTMLLKSQKAITAISETVDVAGSRGLDSEEFVQTYDFHQTQLNIDPVVVVEFPPHVTWARHEYTINTTGSDDRWLQKVSTTELRKHGALEPKREQVKLLCQRISWLLKAQSQETCEQKMKEFFSPERAFDFSSDVTDFADAVVVSLHFDSFPDINERIEVCEGANVVLSENIPDVKTCHQGSTLGQALVNSPRGDLIIQKFRKHLGLLKKTQDLLAPLWAHLASIEGILSAAAMHSLSLDLLSTLKADFQVVLDICVANHSDALKEFIPTMDNEALQRPLSLFATRFFFAFKVYLFSFCFNFILYYGFCPI